MQILVVTPGMRPPWIDGRITSLKTLAEAMVRRGAKVQVLTTGTGEQQLGDLHEGGVKYKVVPGGSTLNWIKMIGHFVGLCASRDFSFVLYRPFAGFNRTNIVSILLLRLICLFCRLPFVLSLWSGPVEALRVSWLFSGILTNNDLGTGNSRIKMIPPIVSISRRNFSGEVDPLLALGAEPADRVCLFTYCGEVDTERLWRYTLETRGLGDLLEAATKLRDIPKFKIAVSIPMLAQERAREKLVHMLKEREVEDLFLLVPEVDQDLEALLSTISAYIYPVNIWEPSWAPISMIEAFACGAPVISTRIPAITQFIEEEDALLNEPGDSAALAESIRRLLQDPILAGELAEKGMRRAEAYSESAVVEQTIEVLTSMGREKRAQVRTAAL